jgi:hypothetical protein
LTALGTVRLDLVIAVWLFVIAGCVAPAGSRRRPLRL